MSEVKLGTIGKRKVVFLDQMMPDEMIIQIQGLKQDKNFKTRAKFKLFTWLDSKPTGDFLAWVPKYKFNKIYKYLLYKKMKPVKDISNIIAALI